MGSLAITNPQEVSMPNLQVKKKKVMNEIASKLENAKLNLIYTELDELGISYTRDYSTVKELEKGLKKKLNDLDFNKVKKVIQDVDTKLNTMVAELEVGSTSAFTKLMTSDLAKTIGTTLGISLAGRTALILAPTIGTKALVAAGLAGYGLYRIIKNRKEIVKANESNELNNILMDLETTKENGEYIDTRFSEEIQAKIREYLKGIGVVFDDTGYRSLRQVIYSLDTENKRGLCEFLNVNMGKGIDIEGRVKKAKKKLNVVASSAATVSAGATLGINLANTINAVDPGIAAGVLNGTVIGAWVESVVNKPWFSALSGGLGLIGTEVLERLPYVGSVFHTVFAAENLATFATIGAAGGLAASVVLGLISAGKSIRDRIKNNKETKDFMKLDQGKYSDDDKEELAVIAEKMKEPANLVESVIVDIVLGYLKDERITLEGNPKSVSELKDAISKLPKEDKKKANNILNTITYNMDNNPKFVKDLKKAGKISIGLFTAGLAAMSVYDILIGGTFLPELSQKIFPVNNIHTPVEVPAPLDQPLDPNDPNTPGIINQGENFVDGVKNNPDAMVEWDGDHMMEYGYEYGVNNPGYAGYAAEQYIIDAGLSTNFVENILKLFGIKLSHKMVANIPLLVEELNKLSPRKLYELYRYFATVPNDGSEIYQALSSVLGYNNFLEKASEFINGYAKTQQLHDVINSLVDKLATGAIPFSAALAALGFYQKGKTDENFAIQEEEVKTLKR
jgi:hypothetical protein